MSIQVTKSSMPTFEEYMEEIRDLWESRWLTNRGEKHRQLENELEHYLNVPYISLFSNGHQALEAILRSSDITGEVITTPFTFVSTTHAITRTGLKPVFCDINFDDYTIDADKIESLITDQTSAIVPVHVYGNICDVDKIERIAKKHGLKVIYDAAHAFGEKLNNVGIGDFGDASMFSFHATKVFHTIEGGAVTFNDPKLKEKLESYKNFGITGPESIEYIGTNAKMNEFQAAMGICNLKYIDSDIEKRKQLVEQYMEHLKGIEGIRLIEYQHNVQNNYAYFPVLFDGYKYDRDEVAERLAEHEIITRKYFYPLTNSLECYGNSFESSETPVAKYVSERVLTLPLYPELSLENVNKICEVIKGER
jgi:dTDP-4-amino-4,6-dideoxygalactose transaminase